MAQPLPPTVWDSDYLGGLLDDGWSPMEIAGILYYCGVTGMQDYMAARSLRGRFETRPWTGEVVENVLRYVVCTYAGSQAYDQSNECWKKFETKRLIENLVWGRGGSARDWLNVVTFTKGEKQFLSVSPRICALHYLNPDLSLKVRGIDPPQPNLENLQDQELNYTWVCGGSQIEIEVQFWQKYDWAQRKTLAHLEAVRVNDPDADLERNQNLQIRRVQEQQRDIVRVVRDLARRHPR